MTPAEKLKEIEMKLSEDSYYLEYEGTDDVRWLIARVKQLESALEFYTTKEDYWVNATSRSPYVNIEYTETKVFKDQGAVARKALEGEE